MQYKLAVEKYFDTDNTVLLHIKSVVLLNFITISENKLDNA